MYTKEKLWVVPDYPIAHCFNCLYRTPAVEGNPILIENNDIETGYGIQTQLCDTINDHPTVDMCRCGYTPVLRPTRFNSYCERWVHHLNGLPIEGFEYTINRIETPQYTTPSPNSINVLNHYSSTTGEVHINMRSELSIDLKQTISSLADPLRVNYHKITQLQKVGVALQTLSLYEIGRKIPVALMRFQDSDVYINNPFYVPVEVDNFLIPTYVAGGRGWFRYRNPNWRALLEERLAIRIYITANTTYRRTPLNVPDPVLQQVIPPKPIGRHCRITSIELFNPSPLNAHVRIPLVGAHSDPQMDYWDADTIVF